MLFPTRYFWLRIVRHIFFLRVNRSIITTKCDVREYLLQVQRHIGLRASVLSGTMAESVVPNLLRIVPLLLQCRGDASLSMVSVIFIGGVT